MADEIRHSSVTVTAGTLKAAPQETDVSFPGGDVERLDIFIPAGNAGLLGFQISYAHTPVIPYNVGEFIVGEDERLRFDMERYGDSGSWQVRAYNLDVWDHILFIVFHLKIVRQQFVIIGGPVPYVAPSIGDTAPGDTVITPVREPPVTEPPDPVVVEPPPPDDTPVDEIPPDTTTPDEPPPPDTETPPEPPVAEPPATPEPPAAPAPEPTHETPAPPIPLGPSSPHDPQPPPCIRTVWQSWQDDGDVHKWHFYTSGPRAGQLVNVGKEGNSKPVPTTQAQASARGNWSPAWVTILSGHGHWARYLGTETC